MSNEFFMAMVPPTVTHQEKQVGVAGGKPVFYEPPELKAARQKLVAYLGQHVPDEPYHCGVEADHKVVLPQGKTFGWYLQTFQTGYGQSAETIKGLHDESWFLG
ncbi:MAG: RusA family crossover junction endodeoxyribonuclease [Ruminococcus sp.]